MRLQRGDTIAQYRLLEQLGQGGMAVVFRAHQPSLDRDVAIKILSVAGPGFIERFRREARAVSRLRHPNILTVFDFGEEEDLAYMVGEYVPSGTLASRLGRPLPTDWVGAQLAALASALDYAHARGIIHRDVKPSNVLMTQDEQPILSDFGVAKLVSESAANLTAVGMVVGTPEYMSPEQALGHEVGPSSDVYALGVMLYQMLVGRPPFQGPTPLAVALAHVHHQPPAPRTFYPELAPQVERVVLRALTKDPGQRYQRASELAAEYGLAIGVDPRQFLTLGGFAAPSTASYTLLGAAEQSRSTPAASLAAGTPPVSGAISPASSEVGPRSGGDSSPVPSQVSDDRRNGRAPLVAGLVAGIAVLLAIGLLIRDQFPDIPLQFRDIQLQFPDIQPFVAAPTPIRPSVAVVSTTVVAAPTLTVAPLPTLAPTATVDPLPTLRLAPTAGGLGLRLVSPVNGAQVPAEFFVRGARDQPLRDDQHLWLLARPRQGPDNWWAGEQEIVPSTSGEWETKVYLGGEPGLFHRLAVGIADQSAHELILKQLAERPGEPFERGPPPGFTILIDISVEKRAD